MVGSIEYGLRLARAGFALPIEQRQALTGFMAPVVQKMVDISKRAAAFERAAGASVKDVKLEELFPWLNPKTPNLDDFFLQTTIRLEEIRALPNQLFIEKFLLPQASAFASN